MIAKVTKREKRRHTSRRRFALMCRRTVSCAASDARRGLRFYLPQLPLVTVSLLLTDEVPSDALIGPVVLAFTLEVVTMKGSLTSAPAGTNAEAGTEAAGLPLESAT